MHLFVDISSHGFGHLAITAPVLNAVAEIVPDLRLTVRSGLPAAKLRQRIHCPFEHIAATSDFGYVMIDAMSIDLAATAAAYRAAHADWPARVAAEADFLASARTRSGAEQRQLPATGRRRTRRYPGIRHLFAELGRPLRAFFRPRTLGRDYPCRNARRLPQRPDLPARHAGDADGALDNLHDIGPIAAIGRRHDLGLNGDKAVLIAMGGVAHQLPVDHWPRVPGVRWLVAADWQCRHPDAVAYESFGLSFTDLLCSVDAVITKPGYGTFTEAAANGTPVLYQRRDRLAGTGLPDRLAARQRPLPGDLRRRPGGRQSRRAACRALAADAATSAAS